MPQLLRIALIVSLALLTGCATRSVTESVVNRWGLQIELRSQKPLFGETITRGYDQPAVISVPRLESILRGIEIDIRKSDSSAIRERRSAIRASIVTDVAEGLAEAFAEANPDQRIVVMALRKQQHNLVFDRKYLTSFVAWIEKEKLYIALSRVEWEWDPKSKNERLPTPSPEEGVMPFSVVANDVYEQSARQTVRVDWRSSAFGPAPQP
jgi:hypothetical protein